MRRRFFTTACAFLLAAVFASAATVRGSVMDTEGNPVAGAAVSDGFSVVTSGEDGLFSIDADPQASYVYVSIPSGYAVPEFQGSPFIYKKISVSKRAAVNFVLRPIKEEQRFNLVACADIQCRNMFHLRRFACETAPDIRRSAAGLKGHTYGIALGDLAYSESTHNANFILPKLRGEMASDKTGLLMFTVNGNHDFDFENGGLDERNRSLMVRAKRLYESVYGPRNYSFNRGRAHIVCMDDVVSVEMGSHRCKGGFLEEQVEWLREDLRLVPKDRLVILCLHIPLSSKKMEGSREAARVLSMLGEYENAVVLSGHTHTNSTVTLPGGVQEHIVGAVSGIWWWSNLNADGTPNGYAILSIDGNRVVDYAYKGTGHPRSFQLRAYRGDAAMGGEKDKYGMMKFPYGHSDILANVWNWEEGWKVELYEDGRKTADMSRIPTSARTVTPVPGSSQDWWAIGYQTGILGRGNRPNRLDYCPECTHMFKATLSNPETRRIKVVATDKAGRRYVCREVLSGADYSEAEVTPYQGVEAMDKPGDNG